MSAPVATYYVPDDAGWAACLMVDLRCRGITIWDSKCAARDGAEVASRARAILIVHSWHRGQGGPSSEEILAVRDRGGPVVVVRRNETKLGIDDYPALENYPRVFKLALWDDYYQPGPSSDREVGGGFANLLTIFAGRPAELQLRSDYIFISYRQESDRAFVQEQVRPCLALAGYASWDYRMSEHLSERAVATKLRERVAAASAVLLVATAHWWSPYTALELATAREFGLPVLAVRPAATRESRRAAVSGIPIHVMSADGPIADSLVDALAHTGIRTFGSE